MCCTRLAENTGRKKVAKNRHLRTIAQLCPVISSQLRHVYYAYRQLKENMLNSNIFSTCPHNMTNFGPLTDEIGWRVWSTPANFNGFRVLTSLLHETNQTLHDVWSSPGVVGLHYIYIFGDGILSGAKFTMRPSLAFSYRPLGHIAARRCELLR